MNSRLLPPRFRRVVLSGYIFFCACGGHAQSPTPVAPPTRSAAEGPFIPAPALPGGIVLALYPPDSPLLKRERLHEAETYNSTTGGVTHGGKVQSTLNIHNPSIEVHLAPGRTNTGAAAVIAETAEVLVSIAGPDGDDRTDWWVRLKDAVGVKPARQALGGEAIDGELVSDDPTEPEGG